MNDETVNETGTREVLLFLDPDEILIPEESNVRPYVGGTKAGDDEKEIQDLEKLGQSIAAIGQLQPIVVVRNTNVGGPQYSLIAGRRRTKAVKMYNLGADEPIKLKAVVDSIKYDKTRAKAMFQHALHENVHRKNLNPLQFALNVQTTRARMSGSKGAAQTQKIAEFFGVSPASITQAEKLLDLPTDIQAKVATGELGTEAALEVVKHGKTAEERKEIVELAAEIQEAEETPEPTAETTTTTTTATTPRKKAKKRKSKGIKAKNVRAAARQVTGAGTKRGRTEILDFFRSQLGPVNGHPNGAIHLFCDGLLMWVEGKVSDKKLNGLWDALVKKADRGTPEKKEETVATPGPSRKLGAAGKPAPKKKVAKSRKKK